MSHIPVLLHESCEGLKIRSGGIYVDGTLGRGSHAREILKSLGTGRLIAIDKDSDAIDEATVSLSEYKDKITFVHGDFREISAILDDVGVEAVDGMIFDLGVSSPQLDISDRGFSYMQDARLDMRMNRQDELTAFDVVNSWSVNELRRVFYEYGEERYSSSIARAIERKREVKSIVTTFDLSAVILSAIPAAARREAQHPSKRCFQALRIAVNDELGALKGMLENAPGRLSKGSRICVIGFHSLEDRLVKLSFAARAKGCVCPRDFPVCVCGTVPELKVITKKPIIPDKAESERNPRARSAKLRIAEKI